jgi:hypothetical protein
LSVDHIHDLLGGQGDGGDAGVVQINQVFGDREILAGLFQVINGLDSHNKSFLNPSQKSWPDYSAVPEEFHPLPHAAYLQPQNSDFFIIL